MLFFFSTAGCVKSIRSASWLYIFELIGGFQRFIQLREESHNMLKAAQVLTINTSPFLLQHPLCTSLLFNTPFQGFLFFSVI